MTELVTIISNASPVLAAVIIGILFKLRSYAKDIVTLQKRLDAYDALHIEATLASINANLEFIKAQILQLSRQNEGM